MTYEFERYEIDDTGRIFVKGTKIEISPRAHKVNIFIGGEYVSIKRAEFLFDYVWKIPRKTDFFLHLDGDKHNYARTNIVCVDKQPGYYNVSGQIQIGETIYPNFAVAGYLAGIPYPQLKKLIVEGVIKVIK